MRRKGNKKEPNNKMNKQTKTYRHTQMDLYKVRVPARQLLTDQRRRRLLPAKAGCLLLRTEMDNEGWTARGGNTASGREQLIRLETRQTDTADPSSPREKLRSGGTRLGTRMCTLGQIGLFCS